ncbi:hypothetical protein C5E51_14835 [Nocardia nova]|nr:hypothetical protein C5E46_08475 [Nocardia nova]PPJ08499.1 hypothetical protein C5E51_14835 [Nocardia nova]
MPIGDAGAAAAGPGLRRPVAGADIAGKPARRSARAMAEIAGAVNSPPQERPSGAIAARSPTGRGTVGDAGPNSRKRGAACRIRTPSVRNL